MFHFIQIKNPRIRAFEGWLSFLLTLRATHPHVINTEYLFFGRYVGGLRFGFQWKVPQSQIWKN